MGFASLWPFIAFGLVTLLHYLSLKIQDRYQFYTKTFGKFGFWIHFVLTFLLWIYLGKLLSGVSLPWDCSRSLSEEWRRLATS